MLGARADNLASMSRRLALFVSLALAVAACTGQGTVTSTTGPPAPPTSGGPATSSTIGDVTTTTTVTLVTTTTQPDLSALEGLSDEVKAQLAELIRVAQEIRELAFVRPPRIVVVTAEELAERVMASIQEEAEHFPADEALYKLLGLLDEGDDLEELLLEVYGDAVAGFYDLDTEEIVVPSRDEGFSLIQQSTLVHELVHALTDQNLDIAGPYEEMVDTDRFDQAGGYQALLEGDASLAEFIWIQSLSRDQITQLLAESLEVDLSSFHSAPEFIQDALIFPYDTGLAFVQDLHDSGGWAAVNNAYAVFPGLPASTEQVITPDDFGRDLPIVVELPAIEINGYELTTASVWGESGFRIMLDQVLGASTAARAADGWGGDAYYQWFDGTRAAFLIGYRGDTVADLQELEDALVDFALTSVPDEDFVWVEEVDGILYFIAADDTEVGLQIRAAVGAG